MTDDDTTVRIPVPRTVAPAPAARGPGGGLRLAILGGAVLTAGAGAVLAWLWLGRGPAEPPPKPEDPAAAAPPSVPVPSSPVAPAMAPPRLLPAIGPPIASQAEILAHRATAPTVFRLAENPSVFVIDFPGLAAQGAALNRVAALVEKVAQPRDRVLDDVALARAIAASGDTPATYYYGHNYRGRDLERFFALAARDGIALTPEETWLRDELTRLRRLVPAPEEFAVITVPGLESLVDPAMRGAILHHEIGHGHFFTNPRFAAHVAHVWREVMTEAERTAFRAFLQREGYDPALEEVMMNEAMAYLLFTPDQRFFTPSHAGLTEARAAMLAAALREGAPR
ncbi:hypothetical protein [Neoroseomonas soli]|uniref:Uncharacterized protein n=1 Tax=Neoroseomonas soli TaxID=1081025 RepID=A0A9X9X4X8_9PROT|nr:hypothetical protein [Neoroseomonas soli]MBR0674457.1 hypothetical protein [Neoroseomonas soli]